VYLIGRGNVKYANKRFSTLKNDYEISLDKNALVQPADEDPSIPHNNFSFVDIADLGKHNKDEVIDIIAALLEVGNAEDFRSQAGNDLQKRVIKVGDASNAQVEITLWGEQAINWGAHPGTVILLKGVKVSEFNQRSLTVLRSSKLEVEPQFPEADRVRQWYDTIDPATVPSMSNSDFKGRGRGGDGGFGGGDQRKWDDTRKTFAAIKKESLGAQAGAQGNLYFNVRATITGMFRSILHVPRPLGLCEQQLLLQRSSSQQ
jgi:replication factor A1